MAEIISAPADKNITLKSVLLTNATSDVIHTVTIPQLGQVPRGKYEAIQSLTFSRINTDGSAGAQTWVSSSAEGVMENQQIKIEGPNGDSLKLQGQIFGDILFTLST